ncbi:MAG TPA: GtrA family protein [Opitutaceae bacterium]|nr:GtrA family protein [Opitutaceae bacterium]
MKSEFWTKVMRFGAVGLLVMGCFMGLNWLLSHWCGKQAAFLLSYPPALGLHFLLNKLWTFGCQRSDLGRQAGEYALMVAVTFLVQWGVFSALAATTAMPGWLEAGAANAAQMGITFFVMQRRIFAPIPSS